MLEDLFNPLGFLMDGLKSAEERLKKEISDEPLRIAKRGYVEGTIQSLHIQRDSAIRVYGKKNRGIKRFSDGIDELARKYSQYLPK
jgi:hypothetical protein